MSYILLDKFGHPIKWAVGSREVNLKTIFKHTSLDNIIKEVSLTTLQIDPRSELWYLD